MKAKKLLLALMSLSLLTVFAQGSIEGNLTNEKGAPLSYANITLYQDSVLITGTASDIEGFYFIDNLKEGRYDVVISYMYKNSPKQAIEIKDRETFVYNTSVTQGTTLKDIVVERPKSKNKLLDKFDPKSLYVDNDFITKEARPKSVPDLVKVSTNATPTDKEGNFSYRGSRPGGGTFYVDGLAIAGNLDIPTSAIQYMKVYNGGVPARYGNTTSAVIVIETKSVFDFFN